MQKRLFDIGCSDESKCQACHEEEGTEKHRLCHCPGWYEIRREIPEAFRKWEEKANTSKKEWEVAQEESSTHPLSESQVEQGSLQDGKVGVGEAQKVGAYQQKVSRDKLQLTALFWVPLASGEHVAGQW